MTYVSGIDAGKISNSATYNAVKIQINDPRTNIPEGHKPSLEDNNTYNAVAIEVNRPSIEAGHKHDCKCIYDYPQAKIPLTSDVLPLLPVYQATNFINNRTLINAGVDFDKQVDEKNAQVKNNEVYPKSVLLKEEIVAVPLPNVTTPEAEKKEAGNISFNGLNFKANEPTHEIEIVPSVDIKPEVNISEVLQKLTSPNFDVQAKQMAEIASTSSQSPAKAVSYITSEVFGELINILEKDTKTLTPPTDKQIAIRKQIIENEIAKKQAEAQQKKVEEIDLPHTLSQQDIEAAIQLSPLEQAERNKEYALYTIAVLDDIYVKEVEKHTGNIIPLTDLPGASEMVNALKSNSNLSVKISAMEALLYINRPEYKEEIQAVLQIATKDSNPYVAEFASNALNHI